MFNIKIKKPNLSIKFLLFLVSTNPKWQKLTLCLILFVQEPLEVYFMAFIDPYEVYVLSENPDNLRGKKSPYHASRKRDRGPSLQHDVLNGWRKQSNVARPIQEAMSFSSV